MLLNELEQELLSLVKRKNVQRNTIFLSVEQNRTSTNSRSVGYWLDLRKEMLDHRSWGDEPCTKVQSTNMPG